VLAIARAVQVHASLQRVVRSDDVAAGSLESRVGRFSLTIDRFLLTHAAIGTAAESWQVAASYTLNASFPERKSLSAW